MVARDLGPIDERRFVEPILVVEPGDHIIAALAHLARSFRKARLVPIDERNNPGPGNVKKKRAEKDDNEIADCGWQGGDSKIARRETQTGISAGSLAGDFGGCRDARARMLLSRRLPAVVDYGKPEGPRTGFHARP